MFKYLLFQYICGQQKTGYIVINQVMS